MHSSKSYSLNSAMIDDAQARAAQDHADNFGQKGRDDPALLYIEQRYDGYTDENQETWRILYERQMEYLAEHASRTYLEGAKTINLRADRIPPLDEINARLKPRTGWQSRAVPGYLPPRAFFACLRKRRKLSCWRYRQTTFIAS